MDRRPTGAKPVATFGSDLRSANTADIISLHPLREDRAGAGGDGTEVPSPFRRDSRLPPATSELLNVLVLRVAGGDRGAFRALFELSRGAVFGVSLRMLRNRDEAEEVLQDVYVRIWRNAAGYRGDRALAMAWILAIARNRCLEILRRRGIDDGPWSDEAADAMVDEGPTPEEATMRAQSVHTIADCMSELDPPQRQSIELAYYDGFSYSEVASHLARPIGTVKSQIRRGLAELRRCLEGR